MVKQYTQLTNCVRSLFAELGVIAAQGRRGFAEALIEAGDAGILQVLASTLWELVAQAEGLKKKIAALGKQILAMAEENDTMRRLSTIPGVGGLTAHAIGAGKPFRSARNFSARCGLTPKEHSSGAKRREKGISRQGGASFASKDCGGDLRLRKLFALGASTIMRNARSRWDRASEWQRCILARRPMKVLA